MKRAARTSPSSPAQNLPDMRLYRQPRARGIHLVTAAANQPSTYSPVLGQGWLRQQQTRDARRLRVGAMALGAAFAPGIWLTHELLVRFRIL